ncbi:MAG: DUF4149 domain-containing protein [Burkholderiaceae bacterium]|nr:DUF4149 domain-containing protein [Burkholderiaceae bacterium]
MGDFMLHRLNVFATALWWGSMSVVGFLVVPMLFRHLPTARMAGDMAARLFTAQTWISVACTLVLLLTFRRRLTSGTGGVGGSAATTDFGLAVCGMLLALLLEFVAAPHIRARDNLPLWHSVGTGLYVLQWLCAGVVLWRASRGGTAG